MYLTVKKLKSKLNLFFLEPAFYRIVCMKYIAIMKYSVKNNMNLCEEAMEGGGK
jgi:hypothetical protein